MRDPTNPRGSRDELAVAIRMLRAITLHPSRSPARWEQLARRIEVAAAPELARRVRRGGTGGGVLATITCYAMPALTAAAAAALIVTALTLATTHPEGAQSLVADEVSITRALRVSEPAATWLAADRTPSTSDLVQAVAMGEDARP